MFSYGVGHRKPWDGMSAQETELPPSHASLALGKGNPTTRSVCVRKGAGASGTSSDRCAITHSALTPLKTTKSPRNPSVKHKVTKLKRRTNRTKTFRNRTSPNLKA